MLIVVWSVYFQVAGAWRQVEKLLRDNDITVPDDLRQNIDRWTTNSDDGDSGGGNSNGDDSQKLHIIPPPCQVQSMKKRGEIPTRYKRVSGLTGGFEIGEKGVWEWEAGNAGGLWHGTRRIWLISTDVVDSGGATSWTEV